MPAGPTSVVQVSGSPPLEREFRPCDGGGQFWEMRKGGGRRRGDAGVLQKTGNLGFGELVWDLERTAEGDERLRCRHLRGLDICIDSGSK